MVRQEPFVLIDHYNGSLLLLQADGEEQDHTKLDPKDIYEKPPLYKEDPDLQVPYPLLCGEHVLRIGKTADAVIVLSKYRFFVKYKTSFVNVSFHCYVWYKYLGVVKCSVGKI